MSTEQPEIPDSESEEAFIEDGVLYAEEVTPEYGILGFTLRELLIVGVWFVMFVLSFFPLGWTPSVWTAGISWLLPVGLPTVAVFLLVLRRFSPEGIRRVGSLGIDQFASVTFSVAAVWWAQLLWEHILFSRAAGVPVVAWLPWAQLVLTVALVALTVFAPIIPGLKEDFQGRLVTLAHRNANPVRPVVARPRAVPAATDAPAESATAGTQDDAVEAPLQDDATMVLDVEFSGQQATDEIARLDLSPQVSLSSHASGGETGTAEASDPEYTPVYSRRSRAQAAEAEHAAETEPDAEWTQDSARTEAESDTASDRTSRPEPDADEAAWFIESVRDDSAVASGEQEPVDIDATKPRDATPAAQPFWVLAPDERDVHDERGEVIFRIGPSAWALVIEDRGGAYVVRHEDGRIGYLHDIADITKG